MSICIYRDNFHKELRSFMKDLIKVFPHDRDIRLVSSSINIAIMDDPEDKVINEFYNSMNPYETYVHTKNDRLFLDKIIKSDIPIFSHLEDYWSKLDHTNKAGVWAYIGVLYTSAKSFHVQNN